MPANSLPSKRVGIAREEGEACFDSLRVYTEPRYLRQLCPHEATGQTSQLVVRDTNRDLAPFRDFAALRPCQWPIVYTDKSPAAIVISLSQLPFRGFSFDRVE